MFESQAEIDLFVSLNWIREIIARKYPQPLTPYGTPFWVVGRMRSFYK